MTLIVIGLGVLINAIPLIALVAILGGFIGTGQNAKAVIVGIVCFFPMLITSINTFMMVNGDFRKLFKIYNCNKAQTFFKLILPSSVPTILTVLKINVITAMTTAIVSEFFGAHGGIGQLIIARKGFYDLPMVWAAIFYIIIAGLIFYALAEILKRVVLRTY
jgi:NitT/TauT family transport system permease protein